LAKDIADFALDLLVPAAGSSSVGGPITAPIDDLRGSVLAWVNVLDSVRRSQRKPLIVFSSSAEVYGNPTRFFISEDALIAPISPYEFHKAVCERLAQGYAICFNLDILICRLFSIVGAWQRRLLIWELYTQVVESESVVWLKGTTVLALSQSWLCSEQRGECLVGNVVSGEEITIYNLTAHLRTLADPGKEIRCRGFAEPGDSLRWCADISRLRTLAASWHTQPLLMSLQSCVAEWQAQSENVSCGG